MENKTGQYWWVYIKDQGPGGYRQRQKMRRRRNGEINADFPHFTEDHFSTEKEAQAYKKQIANHFPHIPLEVLPGIDA
jgi:hypothetical protein